MNTILLVEDNARIINTNKEYFEFQGYSVLTAATLNEGKTALENHNIDIIILDVMLPDGSGIDFCAEMRKIHDIPILFLTCLDDDAALISGLKAGGDEYMTKPYKLAALSARMEALLRRVRMDKASEKNIIAGPLLIDCGKRRVYLNGADVPLSPKEFDILLLLVRNMGKNFTAEDIYSQVWDKKFFDKRTVIVHISSLRKKLQMDDEALLTIATEQRKYYCLRTE